MSAPVTEQAAALTVEATSRELHLPTVRQQAAALAEAALRERLSHLGYLAEVLQAELDDRDERRRERRIREARFPRLKYLADGATTSKSSSGGWAYGNSQAISGIMTAGSSPSTSP